MCPEDPSVTYASKHDYLGFAAHELHQRKDTGAPQPWDAAKQATKKAKEYKARTEELVETKKTPKAKTGCLGMLLLALCSPVFPLIVLAHFWRLR